MFLKNYFVTYVIKDMNNTGIKDNGGVHQQTRKKIDQEEQGMNAGDYNLQSFQPLCDKLYSDIMGENVGVFNTGKGANYCDITNKADIGNPIATNKRYLNHLNARYSLGPAYQAPGNINNNSNAVDISSYLRNGVATTTYKPLERTLPKFSCRFETLPDHGNPQRIENVMQPWGGVTGEATRNEARKLVYSARTRPERKFYA